jgi:hypothetical protein
LSAAIVLVMVVLCAVGTVSVWIPLLIYRPTQLIQADPQRWGLQANAVSIPAAGSNRLLAWWSPPPPGGTVVLLAHGRSANISSRAAIAKRLVRDGFGILLFDYRGYGRSTGTPSEQGLIDDTQAAYDWLLRSGVEPSQVIVVGQSLGDAAAAHLAATRKVRALVLVSPFTSLPGAVADAVPWLPIGEIPWFRNRFDVASSVTRLHVPLLLVASHEDGLVPYLNSRRLAAADPGAIWLVADSLHHDGLLAGIVETGRLSKALARL